MSLLARLARPAHPVGRAYSSFFSSKPGGGRHFVSAKPPKPVLQPGRAKVDTTTSAASPTESTATSPPTNASASHPHLPTLPRLADHAPFHPTVSSKEYKLHQFFSLHRPLLLLDQPTSTIFEASDPSTPLFTSFEDQVNNDSRHSIPTIDNPPESSPDADADAARQLAHALVMNRVGDAVAWQQALSQTAQEWVTIHADSTRRKKRKKMKKHKLKKRRRVSG
ncbi:hypothetical protein EV363DRAFT_1395551 [Boletus edulis]|nr:hypothetical protein EV363DRAFT_1395551 [Boletus edulis]